MVGLSFGWLLKKIDVLKLRRPFSKFGIYFFWTALENENEIIKDLVSETYGGGNAFENER
jgi:hypothetical protein